MALTDLVDQLSAPEASFLALTASSFPSLADFNASTTSEALKWTDLEQNTVYQIVSTRTVSPETYCLSRKLMDLAVGMWYVGEGVAAKPYDGELTVICVVNWTEKEQDWKSVQFVLTATVLIICKLFM